MEPTAIEVAGYVGERKSSQCSAAYLSGRISHVNALVDLFSCSVNEHFVLNHNSTSIIQSDIRQLDGGNLLAQKRQSIVTVMNEIVRERCAPNT
jgi:hypothetical protein